MFTRWISIVLLVATSLRLAANDPAGLEFFEKKIRPIFVSECYSCHSAKQKIKGGLRLDWKGGWQTGGESGAAIKPGHPSRSLLHRAVSYTDPDLQMPPKKQLTAEQVKDIADWIGMGAPDPRLNDAGSEQDNELDLEAARQFWAFQPVASPVQPPVKSFDWPQTPLDYHVLAKLEDSGIEPNQDAAPSTLLRRLYFDLNGLPPTPDQIKAFIEAVELDRQQAIERVVDRLLAQPAFGERWGRHWLDVARFSESTGGGRTLMIKEAWRYRDYVIDAFNRDKPYDDFIREQIAGDLLPSTTIEERREHLIATAFLLLGPTNYELQDKTVLEMDIVDEQLDTMGKAFLGLTIGCARCHDHKFDPISSEDYYGLAGILKGTKSVIHSNVSTWNTRPMPLPPEQEALADSQAKQLAALDSQIKQLKKQIDGKASSATAITAASLPGIVVDNSEAAITGSWASSTGVTPFVNDDYIYTGGNNGDKRVEFTADVIDAGQYDVRISYTPHPNRSTRTQVIVHHAEGDKYLTVDQQRPPSLNEAFVSLGRYSFPAAEMIVVTITNEGADGTVIADAIQLQPIEQIKESLVAKETDPSPIEVEAFKKALTQLESRRKYLAKTAIQRTKLIAAEDAESPVDIPIAVRGDANNLGKITPRSFIRVAHSGSLPNIPPKQSGRLQLADWLAGKENPLTARMFANRVWFHLFGAGIFTNIDNIGHMGRLPANQALIDHLAYQFTDGGWSVKGLIREIVLSRTYQMTSESNPVAAEEDRENKLFWRQNPRRLEAEAIRDTILAASGELDSAMGGDTIKPGTTIEYGYQFDDTRRSIYSPVFRNTPLELLAVFDFADPNIVIGQRTTSNVATQALYLMNNPFVREQAERAANKLLGARLASTEAQIDHAYLAGIGRFPSADETSLVQEFISTSEDKTKGWAQVYHGLFASLEFRHLN